MNTFERDQALYRAIVKGGFSMTTPQPRDPQPGEPVPVGDPADDDPPNGEPEHEDGERDIRA